MFPSASNIVSTICRKGKDEANKIFTDRMKEIQEFRKAMPGTVMESLETLQNMVDRFSLDNRSRIVHEMRSNYY